MEEPTAPAEETAPAVAAPAEVEPAPKTRAQLEEEFAAARIIWQDAQSALESVAAAIQFANATEQEGQLDLLVNQSREVSKLLGAAVAPALAIFEMEPPAGKDLEDFLATALNAYSRRGRLEEAVQIAQALVAHGNRDAQVNLVAAFGALEQLDVDAAKRYFAVAHEADPLPKRVETAVGRLDEQREWFEHERETRRREAEANDLPRVLLITTQGEIEIELYEDDYPNAVASFMQLVTTGFYNRLPFYQVTPGFGAIGGCAYADGTGGPGYEIKQTPNAEHPRLPMRGALSLINMGDGTCGSKFLISYSWVTSAHLRRTQPVIGRVVRGMDVVSELNWYDQRLGVKLKPDGILAAHVVRHRPHEYTVVTTKSLAADRFNEGVALLEAGKAAQAVAPLVEALKIAPRDRNILDAVALALCQQERLTDALPFLERAVNTDSHSPDAHHHLAKVLAALDRRDQAKRHLIRAIELKPDYVDARVDLAEVHQKEGDLEAAVAQFSECLKYDADAQYIHSRLRQLGANQ